MCCKADFPPAPCDAGTMATLSDVEAALRERGLEPRGAFHPTPADRVPLLPSGKRRRHAAPRRPDRAVALVALRARGVRRTRPARPLVGARARRGRRALRRRARVAERRPPPPALPELGAAGRAGASVPAGTADPPRPWPVARVPRRAALPEPIALPPRDERPSPCASCADRPCLRACPVGAFANGRFDDARCAAHLESGAGDACFRSGCLARAACPVGRALRYPPAQARFHLTAFLRGRSRQ